MLLAHPLLAAVLLTPPVELPVNATAKPANPNRRWLETLGWHTLGGLAKKHEPSTEAQAMLAAIMSGSKMGPGDGWFRPSRSLYDWAWLQKRCNAEDAFRIDKDQFPGSAEFFARFDRD